MVRKSLSNRMQIIVLLLPGLLIFGTFTVFPIVRLLMMSFSRVDLSTIAQLNQPFCGFENYANVFRDDTFWSSFNNSIGYTLVTVPAQMALGLFIAILLNGIKRFSVTFRVINYLPVVTSWVIASMVFKCVFRTEGVLSYFLYQTLKVTPDYVEWLNHRGSGMFVATLLGTWKGIGWNMVIFLAALQQVPKDLYEAADIDGCGVWKKFVHVTLPAIRGTILFAMVELTIGGFNVLTSIQLLTNGGPANQTQSMLSWMYEKAFSTKYDIGYAAAMSFVMAITLGLLAVLQFRMMRSREE